MSARGQPIIVAVPARDEADRIGACLAAVLAQTDEHGAPLGDALQVVVLANNCGDATASVARGFGVRVRVVETRLAPAQAHAGGARRAAMEAAAGVPPEGDALICTTDADSRPRRDWVSHLSRAVAAGAQAVAGAVDLEDGSGDDGAPLAFSGERRREALYSALQAEIASRIDPEPHNPWPNHVWAWGANLAVTRDAYRRVGGLPAAPLAEDRAFVDLLRRHDIPVRHCPNARVWTSARREGRAPGGLASLIDDHLGDDQAPCDAVLEPARAVARRAAWRARLRQAYAAGTVPPEWATRLSLEPRRLEAALSLDRFGEAWSRIEHESPRLQRRRLRLPDLPREIACAERLLRRLNFGAPADAAGRATAAAAGLWAPSEGQA